MCNNRRRRKTPKYARGIIDLPIDEDLYDVSIQNQMRPDYVQLSMDLVGEKCDER